jgi:hypothetical protein
MKKYEKKKTLPTLKYFEYICTIHYVSKMSYKTPKERYKGPYVTTMLLIYISIGCRKFKSDPIGSLRKKKWHRLLIQLLIAINYEYTKTFINITYTKLNCASNDVKIILYFYKYIVFFDRNSIFLGFLKYDHNPRIFL